MLSEKINKFNFKLSSFKLKYTHINLIKHRLKIVLFCIYHMMKISIPVSEGEKVMMEALLSVYDETIAELNNDVDVYRKKMERIKE